MNEPRHFTIWLTWPYFADLYCASRHCCVHSILVSFLYVRYYMCVPRQVPLPLHLSRRHRDTPSALCHPFVTCLSYCPSVFMSRWSSWSCFSVSRPAWFGGCTESATESRHGSLQSQTVTSSQRRTLLSLWRAWCSPSYWPCSARQAVWMQPRPCKTLL